MLFNLLDLSAAFDAIDHDLLLNLLEYDFGVCNVVKGRIKSFIPSRKQRIMVKNNLSDSFNLKSGVPLGSYLAWACVVSTICLWFIEDRL